MQLCVQRPPSQLSSQLAPAPHRCVHPPPLQPMLHCACSPQRCVHPPPRHSSPHTAAAVQAWPQPPPGQVLPVVETDAAAGPPSSARLLQAARTSTPRRQTPRGDIPRIVAATPAPAKRTDPARSGGPLDSAPARSDHPPVTSQRILLAVGAAAQLACTRPNPAFEADGSAGATHGGSSTAATTGGASLDVSGASSPPTGDSTAALLTTGGGAPADTTQDHTDATTLDLDTTAGDTSTTTGVPLCASIGEPCTEGSCCGCGACVQGVCSPDDALCGACSVCDDATCTPAMDGTACTPLQPDACVATLAGIIDGRCYANAAQQGACDGAGACQPQPCLPGAELFKCDSACLEDPGECEAGKPVAEFEPEKFCALAGKTDLCNFRCEPNLGGDVFFDSSCHDGVCMDDAKLSCGNYKCNDTLDACQKMCSDESDCLMTKQCVNMICIG